MNDPIKQNEHGNGVLSSALLGASTFASITLPVGVMMSMEQPIRANFVAQPDITAYELAQALTFFFGKPMLKEDFDKLGTAQRHWQVSPNK